MNQEQLDGFDDAIGGREVARGMTSDYLRGYREALECIGRWATEDLARFNKEYGERISD